MHVRNLVRTAFFSFSSYEFDSPRGIEIYSISVAKSGYQ